MVAPATFSNQIRVLLQAGGPDYVGEKLLVHEHESDSLLAQGNKRLSLPYQASDQQSLQIAKIRKTFREALQSLNGLSIVKTEVPGADDRFEM